MEMKVYLDIMKSNLVSTYRSNETLWDAGLFSEGAQVNAVNFVYETPFKSRLFCLYYKVKKILK